MVIKYSIQLSFSVNHHTALQDHGVSLNNKVFAAQASNIPCKDCMLHFFSSPLFHLSEQIWRDFFLLYNTMSLK